MGLEFSSLHPEDLSLPLDDGPNGAFIAGDFDAVEDFFEFAGSAGVAEGDAVAGTPVSNDGWGVGLGGFDAKVPAEC